MPQLIENESSLFEAIAAERTRRAKQRLRLTSSLDEIASEVTAALAEADIHIPVFFTVPRSGDAYVTFVTPIDPSEANWSRACEIICLIVGSKIGVENLYSRHVPCVAAGTTPMGAADITVVGCEPASQSA